MSKFRPLSSYELKERLGKIKIKVEDLQMKLTYKQLMWHNISRYLRQNFPKQNIEDFTEDGEDGKDDSDSQKLDDNGNNSNDFGENNCCLPVDSYKCKELCKGNLPCGHVCKSFCSHCVGKSINDQAELDSNGFVVKTKHESCRELCNKIENFNGLYNNLKSNEKGFLRTLQNVIRNHDNQYYTKKTKGTNSFIVQAFELRNLKNLYDIPIKYQKLWRKHINSYLNNYENLYKFISERRFSPHINAFFHSLNEICKSKYGMTLMDKFGKFSVDEHGSNASRNREDLQLIVQMIGGNSILKTDKSFYVDTLFTLFDVQKTMLNEINRTNDYTLQLEKDEIIKNLSEINKKCTTIKDSKPVSFVTRKAEKVCKDNETYEKLINQEVFEEIGDLNTILKRLFKEAFTSILAIERGSKIKFAGMIDDDNDEDEDFDKELLNNEPIVIPDEDLEDIPSYH
ncbi:5336_t:CDS:2 [Entrophospora sp. SA101]|nr:5336_t:CDS:2 [Entrophospora sp. SA101]